MFKALLCPEFCSKICSKLCREFADRKRLCVACWSCICGTCIFSVICLLKCLLDQTQCSSNDLNLLLGYRPVTSEMVNNYRVAPASFIQATVIEVTAWNWLCSRWKGRTIVLLQTPPRSSSNSNGNSSRVRQRHRRCLTIVAIASTLVVAVLIGATVVIWLTLGSVLFTGSSGKSTFEAYCKLKWGFMSEFLSFFQTPTHQLKRKGKMHQTRCLYRPFQTHFIHLLQTQRLLTLSARLQLTFLIGRVVRVYIRWRLH